MMLVKPSIPAAETSQAAALLFAPSIAPGYQFPWESMFCLAEVLSVLQGIKELVSLVFQRAQPKRMNNSIITGPMLAALTEAYVDAINKGAVPTIATAWQVIDSSTHSHTIACCLSFPFC